MFSSEFYSFTVVIGALIFRSGKVWKELQT